MTRLYKYEVIGGDNQIRITTDDREIGGPGYYVDVSDGYAKRMLAVQALYDEMQEQLTMYCNGFEK